MSTTVRPVLSEKNPYWVSRHRYYELRHFCLQYPEWRKAYTVMSGFLPGREQTDILVRGTPNPRTMEEKALLMAYYGDRMEMVEKAAREADAELGGYLFRGVTEGRSYDYMQMVEDIPCCKDTYYTAYRRFFWLLSKLRD